MDETATVYILLCADGSYYTGITQKQPEARLWEHNAGAVKGYTSTRRPVQLVFAEPFVRIVDAIAMERRIKGWSRAKKEALIARDYDLLRRLSRNRKNFPQD